MTQEFEAEVFVPLPSSNEAIDVTSVKETSGKCVKATTAPTPAAPVPTAPGPAPASSGNLGGVALMTVTAGIFTALF